ncbi:MAG: type II toxin-antitoxin system RelE/ParE family toxin [Desulfuromonadaceae bacterium]|nr:type II toxin-antitoxin system RelE/ParE family toxin [Desulfuromonadaceae bacterium]
MRLCGSKSFSRSVRKNLDAIPKGDLLRIMERIGNLAGDPRPTGSEKLSGQDKYRVRKGNYRIVYSIQDTELTVWVVTVGHLRKVYRN